MFDLNSSPLARRSFLGASVGAMAAGFAAQALPALAQTPTDVPSNFFAGFGRHTIQTSGTTINVLVGGNGSPILLLHGYPQTHVEWRKIAPQLSANYTVVIPDLRCRSLPENRYFFEGRLLADFVAKVGWLRWTVDRFVGAAGFDPPALTLSTQL